MSCHYCGGRPCHCAEVDEMQACEAIRQTVNCPTCDGSRMNPALGRTATYLCPDCTDGKIPMARLLERGVQFASAVELLTTVSNDHRTGKFMQWDVQKFLRKVQP